MNKLKMHSLCGLCCPCGEIFKNLFRKDSPPHRSTSCVQISWNLPTGSRWNRELLTWQKRKIKFRLALASERIAPKIRQGQRQTTYSECPRFHPNRFTSGGVIAERVNTVKTHHKVNAILGEAIASRRVIISTGNWNGSLIWMNLWWSY